MNELLVFSIFVFVLALMVGVEIIRKVPQTLHTPLMSGSNAISGISVVGAIAIAMAVGDRTWFTTTVAFLAIVFATINVVGGFLVTDRMLRMFKRR
ncbi:MAG: NAD(P) transhydrogenase subunit alpha [Planctomycetota bacterium]|nr:NAD(P) transhydrogenase subunit alpha [Planctomycetota bacterium]